MPRNRKVARRDRHEMVVSYANLAPEETIDGVTAPLRTVLDCARRLPFGEALSVADSALKAGAVTSAELSAAGGAARGPGAAKVRRVAHAADRRSANPFESMLRAIVLDVPGFDVEPQVAVSTRGMTYHPDLVDRTNRIVIEADSWTYHSDRLTHGRDCVRYSALAVAGWLVLRFTWEQVMLSPSYVEAVLTAAIAATRSAQRVVSLSTTQG